MFPIVAGAVIIGSLASISVYEMIHENGKTIDTLTKVKEINQAQQSINIQNGRKSQIKLSSIVQDDMSLEQRTDLDNFQKAINKVVLEEDIVNPTCSDLASTGYISISKCNTIKNQSHDYVEFENNEIKVSNPKISKVMDRQAYFKEKQVDSTTGVVSFKQFNQNSLKKIQRDKDLAFKHTREINKIISTTSNPQRLSDFVEAINQKAVAKNENDQLASHEDLENLVNLTNRAAQINQSNLAVSNSGEIIANTQFITLHTNSSFGQNENVITPQTIIQDNIKKVQINSKEDIQSTFRSMMSKFGF